jgi:methionine salvage enolase-phosphatase E1
MQKALSYLLAQVDFPTAERAIKHLLEDQQQTVQRLVDDHQQEIDRKNDEIEKLRQERDWFEDQFKQASEANVQGPAPAYRSGDY